MGFEMEYKLAVRDEAQLAEILSDPGVLSLCARWKEKKMKTVYYDTPSRSLSARKWMLRQRMEDDKSIICFKTPIQEHLRGEWEVCAPRIDDSVFRSLLMQGAPAEVQGLCSEGLLPVCGAEFVRKAALLRFPDGSIAELAGDHGILCGCKESLPFTELELELHSGSPAAMQSLVRALCERYHLAEQPLSKFARARELK